jgi:hypothetical protein
MDNHLKEILLNAIGHALAGRQISVNRPFAAVLWAQESIGWWGIFQGYWASEWQTTYCHTYDNPAEELNDDKSKQLTRMDSWQTLLISTPWTGMVALWCIHIHGPGARGYSVWHPSCCTSTI